MEKTHLPRRFEEMMKEKLGTESFESFILAILEKPVTSIRVHPVKGKHLFENEERVPWCRYGYYLKERPAFVWDPLYHAGAYYAQEASSMFFANAIDFSHDLKILDLCAAPGGKSSLLLSFMTENSLLVSNEIVGKRATILYENLVKWGGVNNIITNNRVSDFSQFKGYFDVVMIDAPCSGEGMFRKDREAVSQWNEGLVAQCSLIQREILTGAVELIKPGGILIYSTCTYESAENEENIKWLYDHYGELEPVKIPLEQQWGVIEIELLKTGKQVQTGYYCYPHKLKGEGQFVCAIRVGGHNSNKKTERLPGPKQRYLTEKESAIIAPYVIKNEKYSYFLRNEDQMFALPKTLQQDAMLFNKLRIKKSGTLLGQLIRDNFIPDHEMVMNGLASPQIPRIALNLDEALDYMQRKNIAISENTPKGWIILTFKDIDLGLAKNIGNRINNHYPTEWRIRKEPK